MVHEHCDFEFVIREEDGEEVSAYVLAKNPFWARAFRSAIEAAYGPIPADMALTEAFGAVRETLTTAARQKVIALDGEIDEPLPLSAADVCDLPGKLGNPALCPIR